MRDRFLEAILLWTERELPDRGAPERSTGWWPKVERREAPRPTSLGARGWRYQLRKAGQLLCLKGCLASILAPPAAPSPREGFRGGLANLGRIAPREREAAPSFRGAPL